MNTKLAADMRYATRPPIQKRPRKTAGCFRDAQVQAHRTTIAFLCCQLDKPIILLDSAGVYRSRLNVSSRFMISKPIEDRDDFAKVCDLADVCRRWAYASIDENSGKSGVNGAVEVVFFAIANVHGFAGR